jgi:hypothetical protein
MCPASTHLLHGHAGYAITRASLLADQPCSDDQQTLFVLQEVEQRIQPLSKMAYGICRSNLHHRLIGEPNFFPPPQESGSLCKQDHSLFRGCTRCTMHKPLFPGPPDPLCASKKACTRDEKSYSPTIMRVELLCMHFFCLHKELQNAARPPWLLACACVLVVTCTMHKEPVFHCFSLKIRYGALFPSPSRSVQ